MEDGRDGTGQTVQNVRTLYTCVYLPRTVVAVTQYKHSHSRSPTKMQHFAAISTIPQAPLTSSSGSSSNIERIFLAALKSYKTKTKQDLKNHDLFRQLEACDSPASILAVIQADQFDSSRTGSKDRLNKWLLPTINVLSAFSDTLGEGISLVNIDPSIPLFANSL